MDKTNCSVYVFSVLCSACFSMEWNIPNVDLFFQMNLSYTPPTHATSHTHTRVCALWGETLRKLKLCDFWWMDWWKMKIFLLFCFIISFNRSVHSSTPLLVLRHTAQTLIFTDSPELITHLCAVRGEGGRKEGRKAMVSGLFNCPQNDVVGVGVHSSHWSHPLICCPPAPLQATLDRKMRITEFVVHLSNVCLHVRAWLMCFTADKSASWYDLEIHFVRVSSLKFIVFVCEMWDLPCFPLLDWGLYF